MPLFRYEALRSDGGETSGTLEATDSRAAAASLRGESLFVLEVAPATGATAAIASGGGAGRSTTAGTGPRGLGAVLPIRSRDRVFLFRHLALMLRSGLTVVEALRVCRDQSTKRAMAAALDRVLSAVQSGRSLSEAMEAEPRVFPFFTVKLVESAEVSGELDDILQRAAVFIERRALLKASILTSLTYPAVVVLAALGVATFMIVKVIPKFASFFAQRRLTLPWSTQTLMDISTFVQSHGPGIVIGILLAVGAFIAAWLTERGRYAIDRAALRIPVVGGILTMGAMAALGSTLGTLLRSGVTLLESLQVTARLMGNRALRARVEGASEAILGGRDLASSLTDPIIPPTVPQVVAVGERTGALADVLAEIGEFYDGELQAAIRRMSALIEPVLIIVVGGMVGFVYFAFFQAVFQLASGGR